MRKPWAAALAAVLSVAGFAVAPAAGAPATAPAVATATAPGGAPAVATAAAPGGVPGGVPGAAWAGVPGAASGGAELAPTPPMGWNDWNAFGCDVDEQLVEQTVDAIGDTGLKGAGYRYVNIDDCWMSRERAADGSLVPDPVKFPHGIAGVAEYVHARGLKLGIYESAGAETCEHFPGSLGHERQDAASFAAWGVDYLKYDSCPGSQPIPARQRYEAMGEALAATGRPIVFSLCNWGDQDVVSWGAEVGQLWRTTADIDPSYRRMVEIFHVNALLADHARPGAWNDPDALEVGNGMTADEERAHFSLWAAMAAPLLAGTDLRTATPRTLAVLRNTEVIAVDQDPLGKQGRPVGALGGLDVLAKPLSDGSVAVTLFNEGAEAAVISTTASAVGLPEAGSYTVRDLWEHTTGATSGTISATVAAHGAAMLRVARAG
ncbi:glycoside hydrolase family 27 protein [Streptomyces sp. Y1]|uniref:Alpha-galactosidase n=1 Tax=Streptomyces sp. Y1 TaxID=3238634 RepID=A0AB39TWX5_9ACTN